MVFLETTPGRHTSRRAVSLAPLASAPTRQEQIRGRSRGFVFACTVILPLMTPVFAQEAAEPATDGSSAHLVLDPVVVVADKQSRRLTDVAAGVSVIDAERIRCTHSEDIQDLLRHEPGIDAEFGGNRFGQSGINIRGIGGNRVAVEVDGVPAAPSFEIGSYGFATTLFPDTDLIDSLEVLKGPASTLYGSNSLGGVVAVNTWHPDNLGGDTDHWNRVRIGYRGDEKGRFGSLLHRSWLGDNGFVFSLGARDDGETQRPDTSENDQIDSSEVSTLLKWVSDISPSNSLSLGLRAKQSTRESDIRSFIGQGRFANTTSLLGDDENDLLSLQLDHTWQPSATWADVVKFNVYHTQTDFQQNSRETRQSDRTGNVRQQRQFNFEHRERGLEVNLTKRINTARATHRLIQGIELRDSKATESRDALETDLDDGTTSNVLLGEVFPLRDFPISRSRAISAFVQDNIEFSDRWEFTAGLRFEHHDLSAKRDALFDNNAAVIETTSLSESNIAPKLGVRFRIDEQRSLFAQYVRGFRAPPAEDINLGLNIALFNFRALPNPELRSEHSDGLETGYRWVTDNHRLDISLFYNRYKDLIVSRTRIGTDPDDGALLFQSRNVERATIYGAEFSHQWNIASQWKSRWGLAWTRGNDKDSDQPLESVSPPEATLSLIHHATTERWAIGLHSRFVAGKTRVDNSGDDPLFEPAGHAVFDLVGNWDLGKRGILRLGIKNLADKRYWSWQAVRGLAADDPLIDSLSEPGRHATVSYEYSW